MKIRKAFIVTSFLVALVMIVKFSSCIREDAEVLEPENPETTLKLVAKKTTTAPTIDGTIDAVWDQMTALNVTTKVPEPGNDVFKGYVDDSYNVSMKAAYDDNFIYFLAEWNDVTKDLSRQTWYFDPAAKLWNQESRSPTFDGNGAMTRAPFYEDKFALLFNVNNTVKGWNTSTCYTSCHTGLSPDNGLARHYTNGPNERIDMWHWKGVRTNINGQFDDQYQNSDYPNGRHGDAKASGGYSNNVQKLNNGSADVSVPKYVIPTRTNYYWITQTEIDAGTAKLITAVDANGILTYAGGTIDPNTDKDFQRNGGAAGPKGMPSIYTTSFVGSRGDITAVGVHVGSGWVLEFKRALKTGDTDGQDVDFSSLQDQFFGIGVFDNAGIAHSIKAGLLLKFD